MNYSLHFTSSLPQSIIFFPSPCVPTLEVIMVRGLISSWKQVICYDYDRAITKDLLFKIISELEKIGIKIYAMISDMGTKIKDCGNSWG
uniref:Putative LOC100575639 [Acyrthosiphon pisum] n=1 Tax=Lepeophtheirus salmonis TaxID=72036 RepID=A0A0K2TNR0_LEPSM